MISRPSASRGAHRSSARMNFGSPASNARWHAAAAARRRAATQVPRRDERRHPARRSSVLSIDREAAIAQRK